MMGSSKQHLRELLNEDQEPFILKNYIHDKRTLFHHKSQFHLKNTKPISQNSIFHHDFCKTACFNLKNSPTKSPKSPLFSPSKSPIRTSNPNPNTLFIQIPSRTAALLLEAALRIQAQKQRPQKNSSRFGFLGSILRKLGSKKRNRDKGDEIKVSVKDILRWDSINGGKKPIFRNDLIENGEIKRGSDVGFSCSCNSRLSSAWSENNEEKSLDLETSTSSSSSEELEDAINGGLCEKGLFCSSPFRFILQQTSSPDCRTPEFDTPLSSPTRQTVNDGEETVNCVKEQCEEEEEKEQNSPVSVLDPPFEDDEDEGHDDNDEQGGYELERSFAIVQRAKQQLLHKLRRFERLADLDPIELEKRMSEEECYDEDDDEDSVLSNEVGDGLYFEDVLYQRIPLDMKKLVLDLVAEERGEEMTEPCYMESVARKVWDRLEAWKEVESNTIDMMVELDLRRDSDGWMKIHKQLQETSTVIEHAIFNYLIEELSDELVYPNGH
ncbi:hypothetical protein GIB67_012955 [Kingdonia uniflora]|uniref:DUF4378 domain-containing protein n=1 Tax=Kingdonia uniflora TaxID=39325 RepID=A0A7J7NGQ6_9MAGN|nr:hypothetical protein GIB67_012955 [Kingdonia uniflora]